MRRTLPLCSISCLLVGSLVGGILPMPWDAAPPPAPAVSNVYVKDPSGSADASDCSNATQDSLNTKDNIFLLDTASYLVRALKDWDYATLACLVHPEKGVTFTPYSTVDFETDLTLTSDQIKNLVEDETIYSWGYRDVAEIALT